MDIVADEAQRRAQALTGHTPLPENPGVLETGYFNTDMANANRLVMLHGHDLHYSSEKGWHVWTGTHWEYDATGRVQELAKRAVLSIQSELENFSGSPDWEKLKKWAEKSQAGERIRQCIKLAQTQGTIPLSLKQFDSDSFLLNCQNGILDLRTDKLREHNRADLCSKILSVPYNRKAKARRFKRFLKTIFNDNAKLIAYVQRLLGLCLTGSVEEQILAIFYGEGANGKSTLLNLLLSVLGDYAIQGSTDLLITTGHSEHPTRLARLSGVRLVVCMESGQSGKLDENLVKQLTGGDKISARFMRQDYFEFDPSHKLILGTNHKPRITGTEYAIWRRIQMTPFEVTIPPEEQDMELLDKLKQEAEGILAWLVQGCVAWQKQGLKPPEEITAATADYRTESDVLGNFLTDGVVSASGRRVQAGCLYAAFVAWCEHNGEHPRTQTQFGKDLNSRGFQRKKTEKGMVYEDIRLV